MTASPKTESAVLTDEQIDALLPKGWWHPEHWQRAFSVEHVREVVRAALSTSHEASEEAVPGWVCVPLPGAVVSADHPITCLNPTPSFEVVETKIEGDRVSVRGENTCWFGLGMISTPLSPQPATTPSAVLKLTHASAVPRQAAATTSAEPAELTPAQELFKEVIEKDRRLMEWIEEQKQFGGKSLDERVKELK